MSTYMKTNALNTAFQLLKVIASGKLLQEQITEAEAELHIHFDQKQILLCLICWKRSKPRLRTS